MGYEVAEQFDWTLPDWIIYPTGGGTGMVGMWKAFDEMSSARLDRPRQAAAHGDRAGGQLRADHPGLRRRAPSDRQCGRARTTIADGLRVPKAVGDFLVLRAVRESDGAALAVADADMVAGMRDLGRFEGISAAPEGGAALHAVRVLVASGRIKPHERVVVFNTGGALKYLDVLN